jgi:hypothetical protein
MSTGHYRAARLHYTSTSLQTALIISGHPDGVGELKRSSSAEMSPVTVRVEAIHNLANLLLESRLEDAQSFFTCDGAIVIGVEFLQQLCCALVGAGVCGILEFFR